MSERIWGYAVKRAIQILYVQVRIFSFGMTRWTTNVVELERTRLLARTAETIVNKAYLLLKYDEGIRVEPDELAWRPSVWVKQREVYAETALAATRMQRDAIRKHHSCESGAHYVAEAGRIMDSEALSTHNSSHLLRHVPTTKLTSTEQSTHPAASTCSPTPMNHYHYHYHHHHRHQIWILCHCKVRRTDFCVTTFVFLTSATIAVVGE